MDNSHEFLKSHLMVETKGYTTNWCGNPMYVEETLKAVILVSGEGGTVFALHSNGKM